MLKAEVGRHGCGGVAGRVAGGDGGGQGAVRPIPSSSSTLVQPIGRSPRGTLPVFKTQKCWRAMLLGWRRQHTALAAASGVANIRSTGLPAGEIDQPETAAAAPPTNPKLPSSCSCVAASIMLRLLYFIPSHPVPSIHLFQRALWIQILHSLVPAGSPGGHLKGLFGPRYIITG